MPHGASSKNFLKFCKPFFSNKTTSFDDKNILVEKGEVVSKNEEIANHFNNYFNNITKGLNIKNGVSQINCLMTHLWTLFQNMKTIQG